MAKTNNSILAGSSSWLEQFTGAFEVQAGKKLLLMGWDGKFDIFHPNYKTQLNLFMTFSEGGIVKYVSV